MSSSKIKSLAPRVCPQCESERTFSILKDKVICRRCGYSLRRKDGKILTPEETIPKQEKSKAVQELPKYGPREPVVPTTRLMYKGQLSSWARAMFFNTAMDHVHKERWEEAVGALKRAAEADRDFVDAHYWLATLINDPEVKRKHLGEVLAQQPNNLEAVREMMILNGQISAEADVLNPYAGPEQLEAGGAVGTKATNLRCPTCGSSDMTADEMTGMPVCGSCGNAISMARPGGAGASMLSMAMLERRAQPVQWIIGEHLLACNNCGAQQTIPKGKLSDQCPYCSSIHVIERDVLGSFQQPDGIIPFTISRQEAGIAIKQKLEGVTERIKSWFNKNKIERATMSAIYLPFWVFDISGELHMTINETNYNDPNKNIYDYGPKKIVKSVAMNNVAVCAVKSPSPFLTNRLGDYDYSKIIDYKPELLSEYPAEIYDMDFDKASLEARSMVGKNSQYLYEKVSHSYTHVKHMTFQLLLLPVWVVTLFEEDGDIRSTLVNGQTGNVVLGKTRNPPK